MNILIFRNISCGNLNRKAVSMLIQTMENNEEILQALHGKSGAEDTAGENKNPSRIFQIKVCDIRVAFVIEFENMTNADKVLTQELEDMLSYIAKTGRVL